MNHQDSPIEGSLILFNNSVLRGALHPEVLQGAVQCLTLK